MFLLASLISLLLTVSGTLAGQDNSFSTLHTFTQEGRRLRYADQGTGRVVLLVHGLAGDHHDWRFQIPVVAGKNRVVVPDLAFFGQSDSGALPHTTRNHARDCLAWP